MKTAIKIFVDADAFVALTVETDTNHEKARSLLHRLTVNPVRFLTSNYVFKAQTSKNTSYVDCTNMVFMKRLDLDAIFSFDEVYRKNGLTLVEDLLATK